jgi:hypothetical protein
MKTAISGLLFACMVGPCFGGGSGTEGSGGGTVTCDPVKDTRCSGFKIQEITGSNCKSVCTAAM